jgi:hypothetical protein
MSPEQDAITSIIDAPTLDDRVAQIRRLPQSFGTNTLTSLYAEIAKQAYLPHLAPNFAYIHRSDFYELPYFTEVYTSAESLTSNFENLDSDTLATTLMTDPRTLLVFRTILGLTKEEFAHSVKLTADHLDVPTVSSSKVDSMEKNGTTAKPTQAHVIAHTLTSIMEGTLFGDPTGDVKIKQDKPDTATGWPNVTQFARNGVPYSLFLHQRHYGGAFRQQLDATSTKRGDLIEDAVEALFQTHGIPFVRTGGHNQVEIATRFQVSVTPAPDFVIYDQNDQIRAMLECKGANDGGTARDKALRFEALRRECMRLGGVPLIAVLGGLGWKRVGDTLGPVVRDTDGRVFTLVNLPDMLHVTPFPALQGLSNPTP